MHLNKIKSDCIFEIALQKQAYTVSFSFLAQKRKIVTHKVTHYCDSQ